VTRQELEAKGVVKRDQAIAHLEKVLSHLKSGGVCLTLGEESACLAVPDVVKLKIEAECKADKGSLALEIGWKSEMREETGLELAISAPPAEGCCETQEPKKKKDEKEPATAK
jgi:amphi-Trp domain-containing protein